MKIVMIGIDLGKNLCSVAVIPRIRINNCVTLHSHFSFDLAQIFASVPTR